MHFSLEKLINYDKNRYELARACVEYAKKVRFLGLDEYQEVENKDALVALRHILDNKIHYHLKRSDEEMEESISKLSFEELEAFLDKTDSIEHIKPIETNSTTSVTEEVSNNQELSKEGSETDDKTAQLNGDDEK